MKPFNLDEALAGKPVVTRDGRPVKIAGYNEDAKHGNDIAGWVGGVILWWYKNGSYSTDFNCVHGYDLFMAPTTRKEYIVIYGIPNDRRYTAGPFNTDIGANVFIQTLSSEYKATIHEITITE